MTSTPLVEMKFWRAIDVTKHRVYLLDKRRVYDYRRVSSKMRLFILLRVERDSSRGVTSLQHTTQLFGGDSQ